MKLLTALFLLFIANQVFAQYTLTAISPSYGTQYGGTSVTLTGTNLQNTTNVFFNTTASLINSISASQIIVTSPLMGGPGYASVYASTSINHTNAVTFNYLSGTATPTFTPTPTINLTFTATPTATNTVTNTFTPTPNATTQTEPVTALGLTSQSINTFADVSVKQYPYLAYGDNSHDDTAPISAIEASASVTEAYLPAGTYKTTLTSLSKKYYGPGVILLNSGQGFPGLKYNDSLTEVENLHGINSMAGFGQKRTYMFIGDSITYGAYSNDNQSYPYLLNQMVNGELAFGQGSYLSGACMDRLSEAGTITNGTTGPLQDSRILQPGASLSFVADWIDYVGFWFNRTATSGMVTISANGSAYQTYNCAGTPTPNAFAGVGTFLRSSQGVTYTLSCGVSQVEINGIFASHEVSAVNNFFQREAETGYATGNFTSASVIAAIQAQTTYNITNGFFPVYVLALGTNDIFNPSVAVTASTYKANLISIITQLNLAYCTVVLTVPLRPVETTYQPVVEPFDDYRQAAYQVARQYNLQLVDLSELNLAATGSYQTDGLHPNAYGYAQMADYYYQKLGLNSQSYSDVTAPITLSGSAVTVGGGYTPPSQTLRRNGTVLLSGAVNVASCAITPGVGVTISTLSAVVCPTYKKVFSVPSVTGTGTAVITIDKQGHLVYFDYTAPSAPSYIFLDGLHYTITDP